MRRIVVVILVAVTLAAAGGCASERAGDPTGVPRYSQVSPTLSRSAQPTREGFRTIRAMGFRTVVNLQEAHPDRDKASAAGLKYVSIPVSPWRPHDGEFQAFLRVAKDPANQPLLVYCRLGSDRTGAMIAAYRVTAMNWTAEQAFDELDSHGFVPIFWGLKDCVRRCENSSEQPSVKSVSNLSHEPTTPSRAEATHTATR